MTLLSLVRIQWHAMGMPWQTKKKLCIAIHVENYIAIHVENKLLQ